MNNFKKGDRVRRWAYQKWDYGTVWLEVYPYGLVSVKWDDDPIELYSTGYYPHQLELVSRYNG